MAGVKNATAKEFQAKELPVDGDVVSCRCHQVAQTLKDRGIAHVTTIVFFAFWQASAFTLAASRYVNTQQFTTVEY